MNTILKRDNRPGRELSPSVSTPEESVIHTFILRNRQGLHCRAAELLVKTLADFRCEVKVVDKEVIANGRSIIGLLTLAAGYGSKLTFVLTGPSANEAMASVHNLFESNFAEAYASDSQSSRAE